MVVRDHNTVREGVYAGVLSGAAIAVWLFIVDVIERRAFFTPNVLGSGLLRFLGTPHMTDTVTMHVVVYTVFHFVAFSLIGIIFVWVTHQARRTPAILAGFLMFLVIAEGGFYGLAAMLSVNSDLGAIAWYQIMVANVLAAIVMFTFIWTRHPELKAQFTSALEGTDD